MYEFSTVVAFVVVTTFLVLLARQKARWLGVFVLLPVVLYLGLAGTVLYVKAGPLVPALNSYWLKIHVVAAMSATAMFFVSGITAILYLAKLRRPQGNLLARTPRRGGARPADLWAGRVRLPGLDLRHHGRGDLGRGRLGSLLGLGSQGDLVVHHLGDLRGVSPLAGDCRVEGKAGCLLRRHGFRRADHQLLRGQHVHRRTAQLRLGCISR